MSQSPRSSRSASWQPLAADARLVVGGACVTAQLAHQVQWQARPRGTSAAHAWQCTLQASHSPAPAVFSRCSSRCATEVRGMDSAGDLRNPGAAEGSIGAEEVLEGSARRQERAACRLPLAAVASHRNKSHRNKQQPKGTLSALLDTHSGEGFLGAGTHNRHTAKQQEPWMPGGPDAGPQTAQACSHAGALLPKGLVCTGRRGEAGTDTEVGGEHP